VHLVLVPIEILSEQGFQDGCDMFLVRRFKNEVGGASRAITDDLHRHLLGRQATFARPPRLRGGRFSPWRCLLCDRRK